MLHNICSYFHKSMSYVFRNAQKKNKVIYNSRAILDCLKKFRNFNSLFLRANRFICVKHSNYLSRQGWHQEFSDEGIDSSDRGLKYCFQGTITAKNLRKKIFHLPTGV